MREEETTEKHTQILLTPGFMLSYTDGEEGEWSNSDDTNVI